MVTTVNSLNLCHDFESCINSNVSAPDSGSSNVECFGYRSCKNAPVIQSLNSNSSQIRCDGSYSCYGATMIESNVDIVCNGLFSCANVEQILTYQNNINCNAEQSCINSTIITTNGSTQIKCNGAKSCANSTITSNHVTLTGHLSGANTIFYTNLPSNSNTTKFFEFYGDSAANNATIICCDGCTCDVDCYGNSCSGLILQCESGSDSDCKFEINCVYAEQSALCPTGYITSQQILDTPLNSSIRYYQLFGINYTTLILDIPDLTDVEISTIENSDYPCDVTLSPSTINCHDYEECKYQSFNATTTNAPVCCTAARGCYKPRIIKTAIEWNNSIIGDTSVRCDGWQSCFENVNDIIAVYINTSSISGRPGNIYHSGSYSTVSEGSINTYMKTIKKYDIFCSGDYSCKGQFIENANNLYCLAEQSCYTVRMSDINDIFAYGSESALSARINNVENVYCSSYYSCRSAVIENIIDSVYATGFDSLSYATVSNINGNVIALGYGTLFYAEVTNVSNVCLH